MDLINLLGANWNTKSVLRPYGNDSHAKHTFSYNKILISSFEPLCSPTQFTVGRFIIDTTLVILSIFFQKVNYNTTLKFFKPKLVLYHSMKLVFCLEKNANIFPEINT